MILVSSFSTLPSPSRSLLPVSVYFGASFAESSNLNAGENLPLRYCFKFEAVLRFVSRLYRAISCSTVCPVRLGTGPLYSLASFAPVRDRLGMSSAVMPSASPIRRSRLSASVKESTSRLRGGLEFFPLTPKFGGGTLKLHRVSPQSRRLGVSTKWRVRHSLVYRPCHVIPSVASPGNPS